MSELSDKPKVCFLCRYALSSSLYSSWLDELQFPVEVVEQCPTDWNPPADCGIVITHEHYRWEEVSALRRIYEQRAVPILILADGVLEYRNTWQNPTVPDQSLYQPLIGDKIACIGRSSARMIESWGNRGKTEVVGLPRLDSLLENRISENVAHDQNQFRILIATATTPAFDQQQRDIVVRSLRELQSWIADNGTISGRQVVASWRLTDGLAEQLQIEDEAANQDDCAPLQDAIRDCDAVITTPSTIFLESALLGKPTALLDYHQVPQYLPSAWTISSAEQIPLVLAELAEPPKPKVDFQRFVLHEQLECQSLAAPRMRELIEKMIQCGQDRKVAAPISMPANLLASSPTLQEQDDSASSEQFAAQQLARLQSELNQAVHRLETIPRELADKNIQIAQLQIALDESRRRVADVRTRLFKLRKILGIGKENKGENV